jgi:fermentation-respiration switch protein FrsA (DUF1100 family)
MAHRIIKMLTIFCIGLVVMNCRFLINKMAFFPDRFDIPSIDRLPKGVEQVRVPTNDGQLLQCYWIPRSDSRRVLIYFHGNAGNISHRLADLLTLARMDLNVLGVGYRGYGTSTGTPSEKGIYQDGHAALHFITVEKGFDHGQIYLLGRSIGSTVAIEIAQKQALAGVILVTPLTTAKAVAKANGFGIFAALAGDAFNNSDKIHALRAPLLIIHGTQDEIIPFRLGRELFDQAPAPKKFVAIEGTGHNDISLTAAGRYWQAIEQWVKTDSKKSGFAQK